ncbi:MAG: uracil-DNA glycosylase [Sulfuritalea sp.]|nr:uracil-DNA glycosylase [Sulfuritalea sp.]
MTTRRDQRVHQLGLGPVWKLRGAAVELVPEEAPRPAIEDALPVVEISPLNAGMKSAGMDWDDLTATVSACSQCRLCQKRKQAVLGVGDVTADWLFVGEAPGAEEDQRGEPFVGQAGKLLDNMLAAIGLVRGHDVYIANAVKCRPPENRTPDPEEIKTCRPYLERQIELIQPKLIVALGRPAAQTLLQTDVKIGAARCKLHSYQGIPLIVSYHPAYLLRSLLDKAKAWEDLCFMRQTMDTLKADTQSQSMSVASASDKAAETGSD